MLNVVFLFSWSLHFFLLCIEWKKCIQNESTHSQLVSHKQCWWAAKQSHIPSFLIQKMNETNKQKNDEYINSNWCKTLWWLRIHCLNVVSSICISSRVQFPYTFSYHPFVDNLQMQALFFHHIIGNKSNAYLYILVHFPWIHVCKCNCRNL